MSDERSPERQTTLPDGEGISGLVAECVETARSAVASLHPRRLLIGLLAVLVIAQIGALHDRLAGPRFGPAGLLAERPEADLDASLARWRVRLASGTAGQAEETFDVAAASPSQIVDEAKRRALAADRSEDGAALVASFLSDRPLGTFESASIASCENFGRLCRSIVSIDPGTAAQAFSSLVVRIPAALWRHDRLFLLSFGLPALVVASLLGGMVARMAACRVARRQWITIGESVDFAVGSWRRLVAAPVLPIAASLVPLGAVALLGLLLSVPALDVIAGVLFGVPLLLGLVVAILLLGVAAGWPLIVPAVACEDADAADCLQRAYAYPFNRLGRYLALLFAGLVGLAVAVAVLDALLLTMVWAVRLAMSGTAPAWVDGVLADRSWLEFGRTPPTLLAVDGWAEDAAATWSNLARFLIGALAFAWVFDVGVRIHLFLRRAVDRVRPEEIAESPGPATRSERIREAVAAAHRAG